MELKVFQRKNVSFINMLEFIIKALVLFDTSSLYSGRQKLAKVDNNNIFNQCFNTQTGGNSETKGDEGNGGESGAEGNGNGGNEGGGNEGNGTEGNEGNEGEVEETKKRSFYDLEFKSKLFDTLNKGADVVRNKLSYIMSLIAVSSIYPAIPFFVVLITLYALLKWLFSKIRIL